MKRISLLFLSALIFSGCSAYDIEDSEVTGSAIPENIDCPDGLIDWIDIIKINDIKYTALYPSNYKVTEENLGERLAEVTYMMDENACSNHQMRNGDAAYLAIGTEIYAFNVYKSTFRVIADRKVYQVSENIDAETIGDLYDIEGKVKGMSIRSYIDGSHVLDLKDEDWRTFINEYMDLEYVGFEAISQKYGNENGTFLDIHLKDGSSVRITYWTEANVLNSGAFGTEAMRDIIDLYQ